MIEVQATFILLPDVVGRGCDDKLQSTVGYLTQEVHAIALEDDRICVWIVVIGNLCASEERNPLVHAMSNLGVSVNVCMLLRPLQ
jgi:hypothetical protein